MFIGVGREREAQCMASAHVDQAACLYVSSFLSLYGRHQRSFTTPRKSYYFNGEKLLGHWLDLIILYLCY